MEVRADAEGVILALERVHVPLDRSKGAVVGVEAERRDPGRRKQGVDAVALLADGLRESTGLVVQVGKLGRG